MHYYKAHSYAPHFITYDSSRFLFSGGIHSSENDESSPVLPPCQIMHNRKEISDYYRHCPAVLFGESCVCTCTVPCIPLALKALCYKIDFKGKLIFHPCSLYLDWSLPGSYEWAGVNIISQVCCSSLCVTSPPEGSEGRGGERQFHLGPYCSGRDASVRWTFRDGNTEHLVISLAHKWLNFLREVMVTGILFLL